MKAQKRKTLTDLLQNQTSIVRLDALSEMEKAWLNDRAYEIKGDIIRVICCGSAETEQAKQIMDKITGAKIRIIRTILEVKTEQSRDNIKKLMN